MKTSFLAPIALLAFGAVACKSNSDASMTVDPKVMEKNWMAYATPGDAHRVLDDKVGTWKIKVRMFGPDGTEQGVSDATSECKWILDGHYLEENVSGNWMGQPFHGRGLVGYDNLRKIYVSTWIDNMCTGISTGEGTYDPKTRTFTSKSQGPNFDLSKIGPARSTEQWIDKDHIVATMWGEGPDEEEYKCMVLEYSRTSR